MDDEDQLYNIMQDVLAKGDDAGQGTNLLMVLGYIDVISYIQITTDVLFDYSKMKKKIRCVRTILKQILILANF